MERSSDRIGFHFGLDYIGFTLYGWANEDSSKEKSASDRFLRSSKAGHLLNNSTGFLVEAISGSGAFGRLSGGFYQGEPAMLGFTSNECVWTLFPQMPATCLLQSRMKESFWDLGIRTPLKLLATHVRPFFDWTTCLEQL